MQTTDIKKEAESWLANLGPAAYAGVVAGVIPAVAFLLLLLVGITLLSWPLLPLVAFWARRHRNTTQP